MGLPTPKELVKRLNGWQSVAYGDSRVILNYMEKPVVAYGFGFNGFVCVIKTKMNLLRAYSYGTKHPFNRYNESGFAQTDVPKVLDIIENNEYLVEREIDKELMKDGKLKVTDYERPVLASFEILTTYKSTRKYRLVRLKSGKIRAEEMYYYKDRYGWDSLNNFIDLYEHRLNPKDSKHTDVMVFQNINVPEDILKEAKDQVLVNDI